ncbi:biorientation of chromosomes in cell division protein 1-like 1 [Platysternon megacephalum]|uniref:non-specific serine/threonine protein kinase n=1 Tax=Platysternon megacephalum TaxID=55544 RepID=A0A4D9EGB9_9SAUR|nr:biorientation of chromosomes in cell division protein 1-like 1 [Platysternon megacephalum]
MPAAAGDGLLSEPPAAGFGDGGEPRKPPLGSEGSFLAAWVSAAGARERLRDFQHTKRVGNYLIGRKLGEGSFAKVREGLHVVTGEKVAVKVIDKKRAKKDTYVTKNLRREGQIQQMIRHPNIAQLLDILETENSYYLVMELCPGGNLMHKIYEKKRLEEHEARKYIRQLILAVEHLHRAGVVHRDLKIENLLLDEDNNIKLIDFGLSNCAGILGYSDPFSTQCGSPAYAAPELLARKKYGPKIDVWSIGVNMYAMLTGTLPFTVEPFSLRALYQKMVDKEMNPFPAQLSTAAINLLQSLLEPDPAKRPNIQQALANRWLNENYPGKAPHNVTYPNRIHLEDLSQSVLLHMTEKLGYKNSDVINTVLSNRASNTLAIYFLLNKKLERYLTGLRKSDVHDNVCYRNQLYQIEKYKVNQDAYEDKKQKEQEKKGELLHRPLPKKIEKNSPSYRQPSSCLIAQIQNPKALLKERKSTKTSVPEKDSTGGLSPYHEPMATKTGCVTSCSLEYLEIQPPLPRTPRLLKRQNSPQQESASVRSQTKDAPLILNIVHSFESVDREDQIDQISPSHQYRILSSPVNFGYKSSSERTLSPLLQPGSASPAKTPVHGTQVSFTFEEKTSPLREEVMSPTQPASNNLSNPLGSPNCVKSRGRFPMMGIGQMLRKRNQTIQSTTDKSLETRMPQLQQMNPAQISFNAADAVNGQC